MRAERVRDTDDHGVAPLLAVHDADYVDFLRQAWGL